MKRQLLGLLLIASVAGMVASIRPLEAQVPTTCGAGGAFVPNTNICVSGIFFGALHPWVWNVAPSIASGFGTAASLSSNNGNATFRVNVGTGGTASSGVLTMPTATTGWNCTVTHTAAPAGFAFVTQVTSSSTTSITLTGYRDDGAVWAWKSGATLVLNCGAY